LSNVDEIKFNVSHSHGVALIAFARNREVGIDLERIVPDIEHEQIAKRFFSPNECAILGEIPNEKLRAEAFFNCWTRKESYIKARGEGLSSIPLDQFEVSLIPGEPAKLLKYDDLPQEVNRWSFKEIQPAHEFVASLAVEGWDWELLCFDAFQDCPV
jgi:4'-phosphopantetheinyl transferase